MTGLIMIIVRYYNITMSVNIYPYHLITISVSLGRSEMSKLQLHLNNNYNYSDIQTVNYNKTTAKELRYKYFNVEHIESSNVYGLVIKDEYNIQKYSPSVPSLYLFMS